LSIQTSSAQIVRFVRKKWRFMKLAHASVSFFIVKKNKTWGRLDAAPGLRRDAQTALPPLSSCN
jgi:hypothetical protein